MPVGTVRWFDPKKGYGFIADPEHGDIFVHHTGILGEGYKLLVPDEPVRYEVVPGAKGLKAEQVVRIEAAPPTPAV